jgi:predicted nucleotidyltransferase component of viral defense system
MISGTYRAQVDLLLQLLPLVAAEEYFALKGGTAINLFVRDMPRLSVDIDLTYVHFDDRATALGNISQAVRSIKERVEKMLSGVRADIQAQADGPEARLVCSLSHAQVKVEVNTVMRGIIQPTRLMQVTDRVQEEFEKFAAIQVVSYAELFGGKICAALDRQHPRDLFDVHYLLEEGLTSDVKEGFVASLLSHNRPVHEMLRPHFHDQRQVFENQFQGMVDASFTYEDFEATRERLVSEIASALTSEDKDLLISFESGEPDWGLSRIECLRQLPAVQWKLQNVRKLIRENPPKHAEMLQALKDTLST